MEKPLYAKIYEHEKTYWWAANKRRYLFNLVDRHLGSIDGKRILDIGCGTGCLLREMIDLKKADAYGVDFSEEARRFCEINGLEKIFLSPAENLPFGDGQFDLVVSLDVIEHIQDDIQVFKESHRTLRKGGIGIFSVPALKFLWSDRDDRLMHKRRYSKSELESKIKEAGFELLESRYVNFSLLLPMVATSILPKLIGLKPRVKTDVAYISPLINGILFHLNQIEYRILDALAAPLGTAIFTVVRKS